MVRHMHNFLLSWQLPGMPAAIMVKARGKDVIMSLQRWKS
jgi:hypothetical protein